LGAHGFSAIANLQAVPIFQYTMRDWSQSYRKIANHPAETGGQEVWLSPAIHDPWWDDFLRGTPCGQYQQSSLWSEYKAGEGWHHHRVVLTAAGSITGGFQILWKKIGPGRIGYVSKGPVARPEGLAIIRHLAQLLRAVANELGLSALIVQQPDEASVELSTDTEVDLLQSNPMKVVEATYLVDTHEEIDAMQSKMSPSLRRNLRKAHRQHGRVREATEADLPLFFELMAETCRRQGTKPNPGSLAAIQRLWAIFSRTNSIRITVAECNGAVPAAKLSLIFGQLVTVWKKGWDGSHGNWHPNELLEEESLAWSRSKGYRACDFCSFNRDAARKILDGVPVQANELSSRDEYHVRFGGRPRLLPPSLVFLPNPVLRWVYRHSYVRLERLQKRRRCPATNQTAPFQAI
jgi:hypothetical protein